MNYHVEHCAQYPLTPTTPTPGTHKPSDNPQENVQQTIQCQQQNNSDCAGGQPNSPNGPAPRPNVAYVSHTPQSMEMYPQILNLHAGKFMFISIKSTWKDIFQQVRRWSIPRYHRRTWKWWYPRRQLRCTLPQRHWKCLTYPHRDTYTLPVKTCLRYLGTNLRASLITLRGLFSLRQTLRLNNVIPIDLLSFWVDFLFYICFI